MGTVTGMIEVFQVMLLVVEVMHEQWLVVFQKQPYQQWQAWLLPCQAFFATIYINTVSERHLSGLEDTIKRA